MCDEKKIREIVASEIAPLAVRVTALERWQQAWSRKSEQNMALLEQRFDRQDAMLRIICERTEEHQRRLIEHDRQLDPWLRLWDAATEIWRARSRIVRAAVAIGAMSGAFIGIVSVVETVQRWLM